MSWSYSPALVAAFLEANCLDTEPSVQLNTTPMPDQYYWPDKQTEHSRISLFGMTSGPLTEDLGGELLIWFQADFHAKTLVQPVKAPGLTENEADCGPRWQGWFAKYDHDSFSWKTAQCSLVEGLDEFSEIWPEWGSMRNGVCWAREMSAPPMYEKGSGYWHTPTANDCKPAGQKEIEMVTKWEQGEWIPNTYIRLRSQAAVRSGLVGPVNPDWSEWLMGWPIGWTALKPLETAKFLEFGQQHSLSYQDDFMDEAA